MSDFPQTTPPRRHPGPPPVLYPHPGPPPEPPKQMTIPQALEVAKEKHHAGNLPEAEAIYRQILAAQPNNPDALHLLGVLALQIERVDVAINLITRALMVDSSVANYHYNLGRAMVAAGKHAEAINAFQQAISLRRPFPEAQFQLGSILQTVGRLDEAITAYRHAVAQWPNFGEAHNNLGNALKDKGHCDEAIAALRQALMILPENPLVHMNLGNAQMAAGQLDDAVVSFHESLRLRPNDAETYYNLGNALRTQEHYPEAINAYRKALSVKNEFPAAWNNLGLALQTIRGFGDAADAFGRAISLLPEYANAHYNLGLLHLLQGDFAKGWPEFHWRWRTREFAPLHPNVTAPMWDGSDLSGKRILLHAEQGFGDTIQFARYIPLIVERGARVVLQCHPELSALLQSVEGVEQVIEHGHEIPQIDTHCALMSVPMVMRTTLDSIPHSVPYLRTAPTLAEYWRARLRTLGRGLSVGLVWQGRMNRLEQRHRAVSLDQLAPLARLPGVHYVSLQKGDAAAQAVNPPDQMPLTDWSDDLSDFSDTAALIANLDLVITVDTAIAHLAGALGKPVWMLLSYTPDWRWLIDREDSPWYPTMRLFRQQAPGEWSDPILQMSDALKFLALTTVR